MYVLFCVCVCLCVVVVVGVDNVLNLNKEVNTGRKHTSQHENANLHVWCEAIQMKTSLVLRRPDEPLLRPRTHTPHRHVHHK